MHTSVFVKLAYAHRDHFILTKNKMTLLMVTTVVSDVIFLQFFLFRRVSLMNSAAYRW